MLFLFNKTIHCQTLLTKQNEYGNKVLQATLKQKLLVKILQCILVLKKGMYIYINSIN